MTFVSAMKLRTYLRKIIYDISNVKIQPEDKKRKTMVFVRALENEKVLTITMDVMC